MVTIREKAELDNVDCYAEKVGAECKFYQIFQPLNKTEYWVDIHGENYPNWIDFNNPQPQPDVINPIADFGLKSNMLELNFDGITWADYYGLTVDENSTNFDIIDQVPDGSVVIVK